MADSDLDELDSLLKGSAPAAKSTDPDLDGLASSLEAHTSNVNTLANDPTFSTSAYAAPAVSDDGTVDQTHPKFQLAYQVEKQRQANNSDPTAPTMMDTVKGAVAAVPKLLLGAPAAVINTEEAARNLITGNETEAKKHEMMSGLQFQTAESGAKSMLAPISDALGNIGEKVSGFLADRNNPDLAGLPESQRTEIEDIRDNPEMSDGEKQRAVARILQAPSTDTQDAAAKLQNSFADKVATAKTNAGIAAGQVQNTGVLPGITQALGGQQPSEYFAKPGEVPALTPVEKYAVEAGGTTANPGNLVYELAPTIPGVASGLKVAGKVTQAVSDAAMRVTNNSLAAKIAAGTLGVGAVGAAYHAINSGNPSHALIGPVALGLTLAAGKYGGKLLGDAGTLAGRGALAEGTSPLWTRAAQATAGAAGGAVIGGAQAAASDESIPQGAVSGGIMGGALGALASTKPAQLQSSAKAMADFGAKLKTGNPDVDDAHAATMAKFSQDDQDAINRLRAHMFTSNPVNLTVLDGPSFAAATRGAGMRGTGTERGAFTSTDPYAVSTDGRSIFLNADAVGGAPNAVDTAGHEAGHAVVDYLQRAGQSADAASLFNAVKSALSPEDVQAIRSKYSESWKKANGVDEESIAKAPDDQKAALQAKAAAFENASNPIDENLAEITRKILAGKDIANYALPKPLTEKISDAAGRFFEGAGFSQPVGDSTGMKFNTQNVKEAARQMNDALYTQGADAREARAKFKTPENDTVGTALQRNYQQGAALESTPPLQRPANAPQQSADLARQRGALEDIVNPNQSPATPAAPSGAAEAAGGPATPQGATPATPPPEEPYADIGLTQAQVDAVRDSYIAPDDQPPTAQRANSKRGIQGKSADQVADERGQEWDDMFKSYVDHLRANNLDSVTHPIDIRQAVVAHHLNSTADPIPERAPAPPPNAPALAKPPEVAPQAETVEPALENPDTSFKTKSQEIAPPALATPKAPTPTAEEVAKSASEAEKAVRASASYGKKRSDKTRAAAVSEARVGAILDAAHDSAGGDPSLLQRRETPDGTIYTGRIDPSIPAHKALLDELGTSQPTQSTIAKLNDNTGKTVYLDYKSAPKTSADISGAQRGEEQEKSTAEDRKKGGANVEQKNKAFLPTGFQAYPSGGVVVRGFSPDKWITNAGKLMSHMRSAGMESGYSGINDPKLVSDMQAYAQNHANGYQGDGSAPVEGASATPGYRPQRIPEDRFNVLNAALNFDQSTKIDSNKAGAREGALSAQYKAAENNRAVDPETGDTNPLRALINKSGNFVSQNTEGKVRRGTGDHLESVTENISPDLITAVRNDPAGGQDIVRPIGFQGDPGAALAKGAPRSDYARSGFMPGEGALSGSPKEDQTKTPEFKKWFGKSKVVDEKGEPLVVFKGMYPYDYTQEKGQGEGINYKTTDPGPLVDQIDRKTPFPAFNKGENDVPNIAGFFGDVETANRFAKGSQGAVYPTYLSLEKPYVVDAKGKKAGSIQFGDSGMPFRDAMRSGKYDGAIIKNTDDEGTIYIASKPNQIKSAIANNGNFDAGDPRMAFMPADEGDSAIHKEAKNQGVKYDGQIAVPGKEYHQFTDQTEGPSKGATFVVKGDPTADAIAAKTAETRKRFGADSSFMPADEERGNGFFSKAQKVIEDKVPNRASGKQILATLDPARGSGIKADELNTLGLPQFLEGKDSVSKKDLLDFVKANSIQLDEHVKENAPQQEVIRQRDALNQHSIIGDALQSGMTRLDAMNLPGRLQDGRMKPSELPEPLGKKAEEFLKIWDNYNKAVDAQREAGPGTKFSQYKLPGGDNYKETVYTLPKARTWLNGDPVTKEDTSTKFGRESADRVASFVETPFKSSHWDEPNPLFHTRQQDFNDTEGNKVRLIEEIQSDWHQKGRKEGYADPSIDSKIESLKAEHAQAVMQSAYANGSEYAQVHGREIELRDEINSLINQKSKAAPDAPFKKTWHELAFKHALRDAVNDGSDKIAWITGEQAAERFDLSKRLNSVHAEALPNGKFKIEAYDKNDNSVHSGSHDASELPNVLGKELADKITGDLSVSETPIKDAEKRLREIGGANGAQPGTPEYHSNIDASDEGSALREKLFSNGGKTDYKSKSYAGLDLKVGGEGMKGFYDKIIPDFVRKYVKPWGATVSTTTLGESPKKIYNVSPEEAEASASIKLEDGEYVVTLDEGRDYIGSFNSMEDARTARDNAIKEHTGKFDSFDKYPKTTVHSVDITPAMRKAIQGGQSMFMPSEPSDDMKAAAFTTRPQAKAAGDTTVNVNVPAFDKAFEKDGKDFYVPPGQEKKPGARKNFEDFLSKGKPIEAPWVSYNNGVASFTDGRHRYATFRDAGATSIPITTDKESAAQMEKDGLIAGGDTTKAQFMPGDSPQKPNTSFKTKSQKSGALAEGIK